LPGPGVPKLLPKSARRRAVKGNAITRL